MLSTTPQPSLECWSFRAHKYPITTFCQIEGTHYILSTANNEIKLIDLSNREREPTPLTKTHNHYISSIDTCVTNMKVVSASRNQIVVADISVGDATIRYSDEKQKSGKIRDCKFLSKDLIGFCGDDVTLTLADIRQPSDSSAILFHEKIRGPRQTWAYPIQQSQVLTSMGYSDPYIAVGSSTGAIFYLDLRNQQFISSNISKSSLLSVEQYADNMSVVFDQKGIIRFYDAKNDRFLATRLGVEQPIQHIINCHYVPENNFVVHGSEEGLVYLWSLTPDKSRFVGTLKVAVPGKEERTSSTVLPVNTINHVDFTSKGNRLIVSSGDGNLHVWDEFTKQTNQK